MTSGEGHARMESNKRSTRQTPRVAAGAAGWGALTALTGDTELTTRAAGRRRRATVVAASQGRPTQDRPSMVTRLATRCTLWALRGAKVLNSDSVAGVMRQVAASSSRTETS